MTRLELAARLIAAERGRMGHINREVIRQAFADAEDVLAVERVYAAAEKPAESPFLNPVAKRDAEWTRAFAEAVGLDSGLAAPIIPGGVKTCIEQLRAEKPAEAAPVAPLPWVVRRISDGEVIAHCAHGADARYFRDALYTGHVEVSEVAAAPPVAAVKFTDDGDAEGSDWHACRGGDEAHPFVAIEVDLRPGEAAGETLAKMLAPVGRGP